MRVHEELAGSAAPSDSTKRYVLGAGRVAARAIPALLVLPALALGGSPIHASPLVCVIASVLASAVAALTWRFAGHGGPSALIAELAILVGCFLLPAASYPGSGLVVATLIGAGLGPLSPRPLAGNLRSVAPPLAVVAVLLLLRVLLGIEAACWAAVALVALAGLVSVLTTESATELTWPARALTTATVAYGLFAVFWVGSTAPTVTWFGSLYSHGPRTSKEVAITFDDGPNPPFTLQIADILDQYGVHATFFEVGKAIIQRPDVTKELLARGDIVGNHSYYHGAFSYLDPTYPELDQTQRAFRDTVGVCPGLFRPPHGTHTPFMSHVVDDAGLTLVTWDVSAQDWVENDPVRLAHNILEKVKPGSIILLHDGSDGNIGADRSVILQALPTILDGLKAKGLSPVTVDKLLGVPATVPCPS